MDGLLAELNNKRKALDTTSVSRPNKYMRKGDIARLQEEEKARSLKEERERAESLAKAKADEEAAFAYSMKSASPALSAERDSPALTTDSPALPDGGFNISVEETIRRLRAKGQPIRLFGESDKDRRLRLRALELIEEKTHERQGGQNDFRKALEEVESREREMKAKEGQVKDKKKEQSAAGTEILDLGLIKTDKNKLYPIIYHTLKRILNEWKEAMDERPESVKRTTQGKLAAATQQQSAEYLKPLFKNLRQRNLPDDVLGRISEIVHHTQKRQYQRANDAYLRLSIGNAPWPIGVTMVGIHERSAREKISADQVAHVLNDEVSRKYIQSLKRLITFSQAAHPPEDPSQLMG